MRYPKIISVSTADHHTLLVEFDNNETKRYDVTPGDSWNIPGNIEHGVEIHEDSTVIEVFSPVREEYL